MVALDRCEHERQLTAVEVEEGMVEGEKEEKPMGAVRAKWERARAASFEWQLMVVE